MTRDTDTALPPLAAGAALRSAEGHPSVLGRWPFVYLGLALSEVALALWLGGAGLLLFWPAAAHALLAAAFFLRRPTLLGKRPDGGMRPLATLVLLPYLAFLRGFSWLKRQVARGEAASNEVAPGIHLGRRPGAGEIPPEVGLVVDLMAELPASRAALAAGRYLCLPSLNRLAPPEAAFRRLVLRLAEEPAPLYIHCGAGKGRSATVAAALLVARDLAADVESAVETLRAVRPMVHLHPGQRQIVRRFTAFLGSSS